jgi:polysaccharide biosynthesis/export protein
MTMCRALKLVWAFVGLSMLLSAGLARAEDYKLGPDDVLAISVWLHPELDRVVSVGASGSIVVPPIGEMQVAGMSPKQVADKLGDRLSSYLRQTATVTVTVREFLSHSVYVSGAVARPGRYGFEHIPSVVEVIGHSGGALPNADLARVQIVRQEGDQRHTLHADVASVQRDGSTANLPALMPGDEVIVPQGAGAQGAPAGDGATLLGEVVRPGVYPASGGVELWTLLATAGGLTNRVDMKDIRIITKGKDGSGPITVDLDAALNRKGPQTPYIVQPGDVVFVSPNASARGAAIAAFTTTLTLAVAALNVALLVTLLQHGGHY